MHHTTNAIAACRVCDNARLELILELGEQALTGMFPRDPTEDVPRSPLTLVKCHGAGACGLVQIQHTFALDQLYGSSYGYRSGLNASMVRHLHAKVRHLQTLIDLEPGAIALDIGSNDGTTLTAYPAHVRKVGIDPTADKFRAFYPPDVEIVPEFFSAATYRRAMGEQCASVVTSISMFYDLERPLDFMREVHSILADDGLWMFEQSYLPLMLARTSYDTICHEHLEYYAVSQIDWMTRRAGFKIIDLSFNNVNGGSFSVVVAKLEHARPVTDALAKALAEEHAAGLADLACYAAFAERAGESRVALRAFLDQAKSEGKSVSALGASTKGNVLLQFCGISARDIEAIGDVNADKYGAYTPGSGIPIRPEPEVLDSAPDYLLVLPWHFRQTFLSKTLHEPSRLVFPLPTLEVV